MDDATYSFGDVTPDYSHAMSAGIASFVVSKAVASFNGSTSTAPNIELGLATAGSAVVADTFLADKGRYMRAVGTGATLAGLMKVWKNDSNFVLWGGIGAGSYVLAIWGMKMYKKQMKKGDDKWGSKGKLGGGGAGQRKGKPSDADLPVAPGM
jgi:hypothetical protein